MIKIHTANYGGRKMNKRIAVESNDLQRPKLELTVTGMVEKFATISPSWVRLYGSAQKLVKAEVKIIPEAKYDFKIIDAKVDEGRYIRMRLERIGSSQRTGYKLIVENRLKKKGRYMDRVTLKTDSQIRPEITINVIGVIEE